MISERLKLLRSKVHKSQKEFAESLGIKRSGYSHIENNRREISMRVLHAVVKATNCNINWLLTGEGRMFKAEFERNIQTLHVESDIAAGDSVRMKGPGFGGVSLASPLVNNVDDYHYYRVNGRDMEPKICNNDFIIIEKDTNWTDKKGKICAVNIKGKPNLKIVTYNPENDKIILSTNKLGDQPDIIDPKQLDTTLIGKLYSMYRSGK